MLAREVSDDVARAKCVPERNLGAGSEEGRNKTAPGHVSLIIVPWSLSVFLFDGKYTAYSDEAGSGGKSSFALNRVPSDYLYIGSLLRFGSIHFQLDSPGKGYALQFEYSGNTGWKKLIHPADQLQDQTSNWSSNGLVSFNIPAGWAETSVNGVCRYWVRISTTSFPQQAGRASRVALPMAPQPGEGLIKTVKDYLEPRRLLTTRHHVTGPIYTPIDAEILIARQNDVEDQDLRSRIVVELTAFLDPLIGGPDLKGWPFGRDIYISELYSLLERVPGVNYVPDIFLCSKCPPGEPDGISAKPFWHEAGELIGLHLEAHHLPVSQILPETVITSPVFVGVRVDAEVNRIPAATPKDVNKAVKMAVRKVFHPLHGGPDGQGERQITLEEISQVVSKLSEIQALVSIKLRSDPSHIIINAHEKVAAVCLRKRELVDLLVTVKITP
jgi:hypothetical protein